MSSRHRSIVRALAPVSLVAAALLQGCATAGGTSNPVVALPNGYHLERDHYDNIGIFTREGRAVLRGPIAAYTVNQTLVAGCVGKWPERGFSYVNEAPYPDSPDCRYFILDTPTGRLEKDLDPQTWRARLKELGAREPVRITAPVLPL